MPMIPLLLIGGVVLLMMRSFGKPETAVEGKTIRPKGKKKPFSPENAAKGAKEWADAFSSVAGSYDKARNAVRGERSNEAVTGDKAVGENTLRG